MDFWFPLVMGVSLSALFAGLAAALRYGKAYWLISGYNTMTAEQQRNVDVEGLARFLANALFVAAGVIATATVLVLAGLWIVGAVLAGMLFVPGLVFLMIQAQKFDRNALTSDGRINRKTKWILAAVFAGMAVVVVFVAVLLGQSAKPAVFTVTEDALAIDCIFGQTVALADITGVQLLQEMPPVASKNNGSDLGDRLRGTFTLRDGEAARLYTENAEPPFVHFLAEGKQYTINCLTPEDTQSLYEKLKRAAGR